MPFCTCPEEPFSLLHLHIPPIPTSLVSPWPLSSLASRNKLLTPCLPLDTKGYCHSSKLPPAVSSLVLEGEAVEAERAQGRWKRVVISSPHIMRSRRNEMLVVSAKGTRETGVQCITSPGTQCKALSESCASLSSSSTLAQESGLGHIGKQAHFRCRVHRGYVRTRIAREMAALTISTPPPAPQRPPATTPRNTCTTSWLQITVISSFWKKCLKYEKYRESVPLRIDHC